MKVFKLLICIIIMTSLCGCRYGADYVDPEDRYIVTTLGFEKNDNGILATVETINTAEESEKPKKIYFGFGNNVEKAVKKAVNDIPADVVLSQCPIILIGDSIGGEFIREIFDFCLSNYEISLSVQVLNCENVSKVLSVDTGESTVGHKILKTLNYNNNQKKIIKWGRLSNVVIEETASRSFKIPRLSYNENNFTIDSLSVYSSYEKSHTESLGEGI